MGETGERERHCKSLRLQLESAMAMIALALGAGLLTGYVCARLWLYGTRMRRRPPDRL